MDNSFSGAAVGNSSFFRRARQRAAEYLRNPARLQRLLRRAEEKSARRRGRLGETWDTLLACLRLLRAYARGSYREIPWDSLISIAAAVIYFVMPLDMIPDFILSLGLIDDVALLGWLMVSLRTDIDRFLEWEKSGIPAETAGPASRDDIVGTG